MLQATELVNLLCQFIAFCFFFNTVKGGEEGEGRGAVGVPSLVSPLD